MLSQRLDNLLALPAYQRICQALWAAAVLCLPITSLTLLHRIAGSTTVSPPTDLFLVLLGVAWLGPFVLRGGRLPAETGPFLLFLAAVGLCWAASWWAGLPPYRDKTILTEAPSEFAALAMAAFAYLVPAAWLSHQRSQLLLTLKLINWVGLAVLVWSLVQAVFVVGFSNKYPQALVAIQNILSSRQGALFPGRVTGMAYEPSWLAHQLVMIFLPIWFSATLQRYSAHRFRLGPFSLETLLLGAGLVVLFLSFSRVGIVSFMIVIAFALLNWTRRQALTWRSRLRASAPRALKKVFTALVFAGFVVAYLGAATGLFFAAAQFDPRLGRILEENPFQDGYFLGFANRLSIAERVVYWTAGWEVFGERPLLGAGLGNAGFYFQETMPSYGWALPEVTRAFNYRAFLLNTKSMWVRILAENGILGFSLFIGWYYLLWHSGRLARRSGAAPVRVLGLAGQFALIGFLTEGFSIDSFALPYFWFAAGLLSAAACTARHTIPASAVTIGALETGATASGK